MENLENLSFFLKETMGNSLIVNEVRQFSGGFSNLTYLVKTNQQNLVLRRRPLGRVIEKAHDMEREFKVISVLWKAGFRKIPQPILYSGQEEIIGAPFFVMEYVEGLILSNQLSSKIDLKPSDFQSLSKVALQQLADLHQLDLETTGLGQFGKAEGYIARQINGWSKRYEAAKTDEIPEMAQLIDFLQSNMPTERHPAFLHNDFKYDNLILAAENPGEIRAILDWELSTVGDARMDLGSSLAYWSEADDHPLIQQFGCTHMAGNFNKKEALAYYSQITGINTSDFNYFLAYGYLKLAVIAQQIYQRHKLGHANNPNFGLLIKVVKICAKKGVLCVPN
jgi:aminoglycoside phosphotransferase (APT) family kinase protein